METRPMVFYWNDHSIRSFSECRLFDGLARFLYRFFLLFRNAPIIWRNGIWSSERPSTSEDKKNAWRKVFFPDIKDNKNPSASVSQKNSAEESFLWWVALFWWNKQGEYTSIMKLRYQRNIRSMLKSENLNS